MAWPTRRRHSPERGGHDPRTRLHRVDRQGELYDRPPGLSYVWAVLGVLVVLEAANELFGLGGSTDVYDTWIHDAVIAVCAVLVFGRALYEPTTRWAWTAFGAAMACWSVGSIAWSIVYTGRASVPYPTFADIFWLAWYPLMGVGLALLVRIRFPSFEWHRWMDGLAVVLLVLVAGFALVIQPTIDRSHQGGLATVVDFSYPILDVLLMGAILGVYGLLGWKPEPIWLLLGAGVLATTVADAAFAIQEARGVGTDESYAFVWTLGALFVAYAAWMRVPRAERDRSPVTGMRAVALPLLAQALAAGIQIYAIFRPVGKSERIVTLAVLIVTSVQIVLTRPRPPASRSEEGHIEPGEAAPADTSSAPES